MISSVEDIGEDQKSNTRSIIKFIGSVQSHATKPDVDIEGEGTESNDGEPQQEIVEKFVDIKSSGE